MPYNGFLTVGKFKKFSRTTRDTLHHYDRIGLLSPTQRGASNNYRYYSSGQLALVNVIRTLQELGMSLDEIKEVKDFRTPENTNDMLLSQIERINMKIASWGHAQKLLHTLQKSIQSVLHIDENAITVQFLPSEPIILGDINDYSHQKNDYDALVRFYYSMNAKYPDLDLNYPVWATFSKESIRHREKLFPERYYFFNPEGHDERPAALYVVGYTRGGYGHTCELYERIFDYIDNNNLEICGNTYEEYPLNEVCIADDENYLIRVMITVREKI